MLTKSLWNPSISANVKGGGETVAIIDTGVDVNSCYFKGSIQIPNLYDPSRSKIVYYNDALGDFVDDDGHGTHCAATIAGFNGNYSAPGTGIAPAAKLAIFDCEADAGVSIRYPGFYRSQFDGVLREVRVSESRRDELIKLVLSSSTGSTDTYIFVFT